MKSIARTLLLVSAFSASPLIAQATAQATSKPSLFSRMKAATTAKAPTAKLGTRPSAKPPAAMNNGQGQRTAKSLDCSKQADAKNVLGKDRKSFMSRCKKA